MLSEDAAQEVEALTAIMGDDFHLHNETDKSAFVICIAPEADDTSEVVGALALAVSIPLDYPQSASPQFAVSDLQQYAHYFPNRTVNYSSFAPTAAQVATVEALITTAITDLKGEAVVYEAVTAAREWLAANTLAAKPAVDVSDDAALARALDAADVSEDDLELDSEDVDEEMIEALREVIDEDDKKLLKLLKKAEQAPVDTKQLRDAIRAVWVALTPAQRREMVEDSEGSESEGSESESEEEAPRSKSGAKGAASRSGGGNGSGGGKKAAAAATMPPPPQRNCMRGHSLTAGNTKPHDYRKLDGNTGNCDLCGKDFKYTSGGYHCDTCRNWDCCVACGSSAVPNGGGGGASGSKAGGKRGKNKR